MDAGLYPNQSPATTTSTTTSASVNIPARDRVRDWYCGLHSRDASGKFTITDLGTKKVADVVVSLKLSIFWICFVFFSFDLLKLIVIYATFNLNRWPERKKKLRGISP